MTHPTRPQTRRGTALCVLATVALAGASGIARAELAKLGTARWLAPDASHTVKPYGPITTLVSPLRAVTTLPPPAEIPDDLSLVLEVTLDTSTGVDAPLIFSTRSGILQPQPPQGIKDGKIQPSAIDGTTATVRVQVKTNAAKLRILQPVYYEVVTIVLRGRGSRSLRWTFKPWGKHDDK
jgi:hypothetical protein